MSQETDKGELGKHSDENNEPDATPSTSSVNKNKVINDVFPTYL